MKLLFCHLCQDIVKIWPLSYRSCHCRDAKARLKWDTYSVEVQHNKGQQPSIISIDNSSFLEGLAGIGEIKVRIVQVGVTYKTS